MERALLTVDEVAKTLNLGRTKVYELLRSGEIESVSIGSSRRITRTAVTAFIERLTAAGADL